MGAIENDGIYIVEMLYIGGNWWRKINVKRRGAMTKSEQGAANVIEGPR
jgi:hypothetical protein